MKLKPSNSRTNNLQKHNCCIKRSLLNCVWPI